MNFFQNYSTFFNISKAACMPNGGQPNIEKLPLATCNKFTKPW